MASDRQGARPLLVFADDWGRHPSSCQHLVRHLLPRHATLWVNTIGTRTPRLDWATLTRGVEKLRAWTRPARPAEPLPAQLRVASPLMWPSFRSRAGRLANRILLTRQLRRRLHELPAPPAPPIALTTLPLVADLVGRLPVCRWVYYCVDDFTVWPGLDQATMEVMEASLVRQADVLVAVSTTLQEKLAQSGKPVHLLTHGIDLDHWRHVSSVLPPPELAALEEPRVVFWGVKDRRMDVAFLQRLGADMTHGSIVLVGPDADPAPELRACPRVVSLPPLPYAELPRLAQAAAVLVMPYADLPVTRAMQPLKLKEYLATGRPVVVRDLPATRPWADCLDVCSTPADFSAAVRHRLQEGVPEAQRRARQRLTGESWAAKAEQLERWIETPEGEEPFSDRAGEERRA